jgi:similar to stage IV sporulation protein
VPLIRLWNYLNGYVIIKMTGYYGERLLNYAALNGIYLWDIKRITENVMIAKVSIRDFFRLSRLARKARCRLFVVKRVGLFFFINRLKRRKTLIIGSVLFIAFLYFLSSFVWNIEIISEDPQLRQAVKKDLAEWGFSEGTFKYNIDKKSYLDKIFLKYNDIAWAEIEIRGSKVIVQLVKKEPAPELEENTPCDIIASKDGIIEEIIPLRGEPVVKPGDAVEAGDVLISGRIEIYPNISPREDNNAPSSFLVHSNGIVKARVWRQKAVNIPLIKTIDVETGQSKTAIRLSLGSKHYNFQLGKIPYDIYDVEITNQLTLPLFIRDFGVDVVKYKELKAKKISLSIEEAVKEAEKQLLKELKEFENTELVHKKMEFVLTPEKDAVVGTLTVEVIEDIGKKKSIY